MLSVCIVLFVFPISNCSGTRLCLGILVLRDWFPLFLLRKEGVAVRVGCFFLLSFRNGTAL